MSIRLAPLTRENWCECSRLEVKPEQRAFVPSNLLCIAEAQVYPGWGAYAIYYKDQMVGFVMYEDEEEQERWWISTVMIAADYQGRGYAKAAIRNLIPILKQRDCRQIWVGYDTDNVAARGLYAGLRFEEVGLDEDRDMVARKVLLGNYQID